MKMMSYSSCLGFEMGAILWMLVVVNAREICAGAVSTVLVGNGAQDVPVRA